MENVLNFDEEQFEKLLESGNKAEIEKSKYKPSLCMLLVSGISTIDINNFYDMLKGVEKTYFDNSTKILTYYEMFTEKHELKKVFESLDDPNYLNKKRGLA